MSKISRKSELSPSITRGSNNINLGKDSGVNIGRKSEPSVTSGGIGFTQEIISVGGGTFSGGINVEVSPLNLGITANPSNSSISIASGAETPGGFLGVSGGLTINTNTGAITGGSIGGEVGGVGINVSNSKEGGLGVEVTIQIPGTPIEFSLGLGFPPPSPIPTPTPAPTPASSIPPRDPFKPFPIFPPGGGGRCQVIIAITNKIWHNPDYFNHVVTQGIYDDISNTVVGSTKVFRIQDGTTYNPPALSINNRMYCYEGMEVLEICFFSGFFSVSGREDLVYERILQEGWLHKEDGPVLYVRTSEIIYSTCSIGVNPSSPPPSPSPSLSPSPFPNPPPRKNMDECCRESIKLARKNRQYLQELLRMLGRPLDERGNLIPIPPDTKFFGEPIERVKTPIIDIIDPEKETIKFANYYELQMYALKQQINLDIGVDPQSFVAPTGKTQNPSYQRDSEQSLEGNTQPDEDKAGNKRELEIGKDIKVNSLAQQQQYLFEAVRRFEYLLPAGELADARFEKSLIIPGATGVLQIHNLIHFAEFLVQFLNSTLGNPKIPIKMEDINAIKEGKQEAIFKHFSISQMIRELYRIALESGDDINTLMETAVRNFRTGLANRTQIIQIAEGVQALIEDTGMLESQEFIPVKLEGDPYAGKWKEGMGFEPDAELDSNTEEATEKLLRATLRNFQAQVKVIRRDKRENADIRDLLRQLAEMFIRSTAIPATPEGIEKALAAARYKLRVDNGITRSQVKRAAAAKLSRTKKKKKQS